MEKIKKLFFLIFCFFWGLTVFGQFNKYIPQIPVSEYKEAELSKQKIYTKRREWLREEHEDLSNIITKINDLDERIGKAWMDSYNAWASKYTNPRNYDITDDNFYNYLIESYRKMHHDAIAKYKELRDH